MKSGGGSCYILRALGVYWAAFLGSGGNFWSSKAVVGAILRLLVASWAPWAAVSRHRVAHRRPRSNFRNFFRSIFVSFFVIFGGKNQLKNRYKNIKISVRILVPIWLHFGCRFHDMCG